MSRLDDAIQLASTAHAGQKLDEDGMPHIVHCMAVMLAVKRAFENEEVDEKGGYTGTLEDLMIAAALHDVPEDCPFVTLDMIRVQFGQAVTEMVDGVTRRGLKKGETKETYRDFIYRAKAHPGSRIIKIADLHHNYGRAHRIKQARWRDKLLFKYAIAERVLNDLDEPTWEQASYCVSYEGAAPHYFLADPNGKRIEVPEEEFKALTGRK